MKLYRLFAVMLACALMLSGCGRKTELDQNAYEKIQNALLTMQSFEADAEITYISNKNTHTYQTRQQARMTGEYRIEVTGPEKVSGNITMFDGSTIYQFNTRVSGKISVTQSDVSERLELFVTSFIKNYVKSQEQSISVANMGDSLCTVLEAVIPGEHPYLRTEKLWVSNKTYKPVKLVIYDPDGVERIVVSYEKFEYNVIFDDKLFKLQ